jgi:hypothetical protein
MAKLQDIQKQTEEYAAARRELETRVKRLQEIKNKLDKRLMPGITRALLEVVNEKGLLHIAIEKARELFQKPKTQVFAGVKVGLKKGKGKMVWDDEEKVLARIRKTYGSDKAGSLIRIEEHPDKEALELLPAVELKKLGITITEDGDQVYIKDLDSDIEKIIKVLMKSEEQERAEEAV